MRYGGSGWPLVILADSKESIDVISWDVTLTEPISLLKPLNHSVSELSPSEAARSVKVREA